MKVTFTNFRCLRDTTLSLSPLTVIVGPNASGKSSIAQSLKPEMPLSPEDVWQRRSGLDLLLERRTSDNRIFRSAVQGRGLNHSKNGNFPLYGYQYLRLDLRSLRTKNELREEHILSETGDNLTNVFATLTRTIQTKLAQDFCRLVPVFSDVDHKPLGGGQHRLQFQDKWNAQVVYEPEQVSDGSMLVLAFLTLQYQQPPVDVIAIEEPEHSLHPYLVGEVVQMLRKLAHGELGPKKMHVVVTTHSPEVLQFVLPEEVRFLNRQDDGSVVITQPPTGTPQWERAFEEYQRDLGSIWLSGGLGGVPSG